MAESWSVVSQSEDGGLVDSQEDVDLGDTPVNDGTGQGGHGSLFSDAVMTHFGEGGGSPAQTELREERQGGGGGQEGETGQEVMSQTGINPASQQDSETDHPPSPESPGSQAATPQGAGSRPSTLFETGSMVEVKGYGFGVVQWMGQLKGRETAGVELEEYRDQCGDGTPEGGDTMLFPCQPGHALFTPITDLLPDSRFLSPEADNPLPLQLLETVDERTDIPQPHFYCHQDQPRGIQGEHNSCYIDATLFGLFALSSEFDSLLIPPPRGTETEISSILRTEIINPLRKNGVILFDPVKKLRDKLEKLGKLKGIPQEEKDPEEFLNMLFKHALTISPFIAIQRPQGEEAEFFVQLFLEPDPTLSHPTIHKLLTRMFTEQHIKFSKMPEKLLVQVPRYGKQFKTFEKIIPDKRLDIKDLCTQKSCQSSHGEVTAHLQLLSVICIETSHYVCFTRADKTWVFMDSMADRVEDQFNIPSCTDCTRDIEDWVYSKQRRKDLNKVKKLPNLVRRFIYDMYMCVYVEDSTYV